MQMILHHVLPLAMPGMLTGAIIGMAHALGKPPAADDRHGGLYYGYPQRGHVARHRFTGTDFPLVRQPRTGLCGKTSAAIMVVLVFLICMNTLAVWLRKRLERRW